MPIKITYDDVNQGVELRYTGIVVADEIFAAMQSIYTDYHFATLKYSISDRTECERIDIKSTEMDKLLAQTKALKNINPGHIVAMVSPDDLNFGRSRMYEMKGDDFGFNIMVFRNRAEADSWLAKELA